MKINKTLDKDVVYTVDQLISDMACYQPVELLLRLNLLTYAEYEQWRKGNIHHLSDNLAHNKEQIVHILDDAEFYVQSMNLIAEPLIMYQWEQIEQADFRLSFGPSNNSIAKKLAMQYVRKDDSQMDLFFDNQSLNIVKKLKQALISRNIQIASQQFQALYQTEPTHEFFKPAKILLDALINALEEEKIDDPEQEMNYLLTVLKPLANESLSGLERDYMSLFWHRLAKHIDNTQYNELEDKLHSSFCYQQIPDWQAVINSIESIPDPETQPALFSRYAIALNNSGKNKDYIQLLCQYCWQSTLQETDHIFTIDLTLKRIWYDFLDKEMDAQWGIQHFPAWLIIKEPGVCHFILSNEKSPEAFKLLQQLISTELSEKQPAIEIRKNLQSIHPGIFELYIAMHK